MSDRKHQFSILQCSPEVKFERYEFGVFECTLVILVISQCVCFLRCLQPLPVIH